MTDPHNLQDCIACGGQVRTLCDFGPQPLTNYFPVDADEILRRHSLVLAACNDCATVQLRQPCPAETLKPSQPMYYNEPESHLDAVVDQIISLPGVSHTSRILGMTYKDATTLERLRKIGYRELRLASPREDFQIEDACAGLETIQARLTSPVADKLIERYGRFDIVLARHILEHAHDLTTFLASVAKLTAPGGYAIFEVPDCTTMLDRLDYSFVWEEHVSYFTPSTLANTLQVHALHPFRTFSYPYALENSLVAITSRDQSPQTSPRELFDISSTELHRAERYAASFPQTRELWQKKLTSLKRQGPIAVLGAGHLAVTFINLLELEPFIDFVCDDAPDKIHRLVPGTHLRISSSAVLLQHSFSICLMAVAPESEPKVLVRNQEFIDRGGRFASIFAASEHALTLDAASEPEPDEP